MPSSAAVIASLRGAMHRTKHLSQKSSAEERSEQPSDSKLAAFTVQRSPQWLQATQQKLIELLGLVLPYATSHSAVRVRGACAKLLANLMQSSAAALGTPLLQLCLRHLLLLSMDPMPVICQPAKALLNQLRLPAPASATVGASSAIGAPTRKVLTAELLAMLPELQATYSAALLKPAAELVQAGNQLAAALAAVPAGVIVQRHVLPAATLQDCLSSAAQYMQVDDKMAALLLHGPADAAPAAVKLSLPSAAERRGQHSGCQVAPAANATQVHSTHDAQPAQAKPTSPAGPAALPEHAHGRTEAAQLPDDASARNTPASLFSRCTMAPGLKYVHTTEAYAAAMQPPLQLAAACAAARHAEGRQSGLLALFEALGRELGSAAERCHSATAGAPR